MKALDKIRIQLDLTPEMRDVLDSLCDQTGIATRAEVMRRAISVYSVLVETRRDGKHIELVGPKRTRERLIIA